MWNSSRVLVTGGCGFIGSHLVDSLIKRGAEVTIIDNLSTGNEDYILEVFNMYGLNYVKYDGVIDVEGGHRVIIGDLLNPEITSVFKDHDVVFHLAAIIGGRGYIDTHPADCMKSVAINHNVIDACLKYNIDRIHYASTACVYPLELQDVYNSDYLLKEEDAFKNETANCDGAYGWAKFMGEMELWAYYEQYGLKSSIARYVTAYGPRENDTHAIIALIRKALDRQDPYIIWGSGNQDRDFTYVEDIINGSILACEKITDGTPVNLGTSIRYKIKDVAKLILELTNHKPNKIVFDTTKPEGVKSRALDITKSKELIGYEPRFSLEAGLTKTIEWYRQNKPMKVETLE